MFTNWYGHEQNGSFRSKGVRAFLVTNNIV